jgi:signal transduction histidine kinase
VESQLNLAGDLALTAALIVPLLWRRHAPLMTASIIGPLFAVYRIAKVPEGSVSTFAVFIAIFAAGAYSASRRRNQVRAIASAWSAVALGAAIAGETEYVGFDFLTLIFLNFGVNIAFFAAAWLLGDAWRRRQEDAIELELRATQLAAQREENAARAVVNERLRIARELHDVVAHHVSVMGVQAAGARSILSTDPARASEALSSVEESSRQAVTELQRLVGFLRSDDDDSSVAPQPTIDALESLIGQVESAGLSVTVEKVGAERALPMAVSLSAYRIVQEALTNVIKHAGAVNATVIVSYVRGALDVEVVNAAGGVVVPSSGSGRGQLGMVERAAMVGGSVTVGPLRSGGYRVAAHLPTESGFDVGLSE